MSSHDLVNYWRHEMSGELIHEDSLMDLCDKMADRIEALEAENTRLRAAMEWQPIETAPKDGKSILALLSNGEVFRVIWFGIGWHASSDIGFVSPTHWKPLPAAPEGEG
jgi:hypothetical protein